MSIEFDEEYFEGSHPAGYSSYGGLLPDYAEPLLDLFDGIDSVLIAGCAYGKTVDSLTKMGVDAVGVDKSRWAIEKAEEMFEGEFILCDVTTDELLDIGQFDVGHTECLLSCLSDSGAQRACENMRAVSNVVVHQVYTTLNGEYYNAKSVEEWKAICDPDGRDVWRDNEEMVQ